MEHNNNQNNQNGNGGGGFLLGVMVGVAITLLFTTKKGREIFKDTVNRALDKVSELQNTVEESVQFDDEDIDGDDYIKPEPASNEPKKEVRYLANDVSDEAASVSKPAKPKEKLAPDDLQEKEAVDDVEGANDEAVQETEKIKLEDIADTEEDKEFEPEKEAKKSPVRKFFKLKKS